MRINVKSTLVTLGTVVLLTTGLSACKNQTKCPIDYAHEHLYTYEFRGEVLNIWSDSEKDKIDRTDFEKNEDIVRETENSRPSRREESLLIEENYEQLTKLYSNRKSYTEYEFSYIETKVHRGSFGNRAYEYVPKYYWSTDKSNRDFTGRIRECYHVCRGYQIEGNHIRYSPWVYNISEIDTDKYIHILVFLKVIIVLVYMKLIQ